MAQKEKVLIIDDSKMNIQFLYSIIEDEYDVFFATNGEDGITIAELKKPDIILLDIIMPDMNGYDVIKRIKAVSELQDTPVIFITSLSSGESEQKGFEYGAVDYIAKPFRPQIAKVRIRNQLLLKKQRDMLISLAIHDQLTNLYNRRYFFEFLEKEWYRGFRSKKPISIVFIDVDYFKKYNDCYGHQMGDECLEKISRILKESIRRPMDIAARYGGEEFILTLPETDIKGANFMAKSIQEKLHEEKIPHKDSDVDKFVTFSIGIATMIPNGKTQFEDLIKIADDNLYLAKKQGRNCIVGYDESSK